MKSAALGKDSATHVLAHALVVADKRAPTIPVKLREALPPLELLLEFCPLTKPSRNIRPESGTLAVRLRLAQPERELALDPSQTLGSLRGWFARRICKRRYERHFLTLKLRVAP